LDLPRDHLLTPSGSRQIRTAVAVRSDLRYGLAPEILDAAQFSPEGFKPLGCRKLLRAGWRGIRSVWRHSPR